MDGWHETRALLTPRETASLLRMSLRTLQAFVYSGQIRYVNVGRGEKRVRRMFAQDAIDDFVKARTRRDAALSARALKNRWQPTLKKVASLAEKRRQRLTDRQRKLGAEQPKPPPKPPPPQP